VSRLLDIALILAPWVFGVGFIVAFVTGRQSIGIVCFFGAAYCLIAHDSTPPMG
jgi:hypothetical protein